MILEYKGDRVNIETMALGINLSTHLDHALSIANDNGLKFLIKKVVKTKDPLLCKMLRNISQHNELRIKIKFLVECSVNFRIISMN